MRGKVVKSGKVAARGKLKQNSDLVAAREASAANRYKIKAEFFVNAARDTPALFYVIKACIIRDCIGQDCAVRAHIVKACIGVARLWGEI